MAKRAELIREISVDDGTFDDIPEMKTDAEQALDDFMEKARSAGATAKITVNKLTGSTNSSETFCSSFPVDKYDYFELLDVIQRSWGAGDYRIYCTVKGRKGLLQNQLISVNAPMAQPQLSAPQASGNSDIMASMLKAINDSNDRLLSALKPSAGDEDGEVKQLQKMMLYKQLFSSPQSANTDTIGQMKGMIELMAMMQGFGGAGESESGGGLMKALEAFAPVAAAALSRPRVVVPPPQRPAPRPAPAPVQGRTVDARAEAPKPAPQPAKEEASPMAAYSEQVNQLCLMLNFTTPDPAEVAEKVAEGVTDEQAEQLTQWLSMENALEELLKTCPNSQKHKQWFDDFIEHLRGIAGLPSRFADQYPEEVGTEFDNAENAAHTTGHENQRATD